jgi:hypothetical protein
MKKVILEFRKVQSGRDETKNYVLYEVNFLIIESKIKNKLFE